MKRFLILCLTILLLAASAGAVYFFLQAGRISTVPVGMKSKNVARISIKNSQGHFAFVKDGERWNVRVPASAGAKLMLADGEKVSSLLRILFSLKVKDVLLEKSASGAFSQVLIEIDISNANGIDAPTQLVRLVIGHRHGDNHTYVYVSGHEDRVFRISSKYLDSLVVSDADYVDSHVLPFEPASAVKLQLAQKYAGGWTVIRDEDGFVFELPAYLSGTRAASAEVKLYLMLLAGLKADDFLPVAEPLPAESEAFLNVWIKGQDAPFRMDLYKAPIAGEGYMATSGNQPGVFRFDAETVRQLLKTPFELQGRSVIDLDIGRIAYMSVFYGDQEFVAKKTETGWFEQGSEKQLAGIDMSLWRFNELKFESLPLRTLPASASWVMSCEFRDDKNEKVATLNFFADPELPAGQSWLKNGGKLYYPVSNQLMKDIQGLFPGKNVE